MARGARRPRGYFRARCPKPPPPPQPPQKEKKPPPPKQYGAAPAFTPQDLPRVPRADLELLKPLGDGRNGEVHLCCYRGATYAVKLVKEGTDGQDTSRKAYDITHEAYMTRAVEHPHVVPVLFLVIGSDSEVTGYAMPVAAGTLMDIISNGEVAKMGWRQKLGLCRGVARGVEHMQSRGYFHGDLKPENILVMRDGSGGYTAQVADLGLAQRIAPGEHAYEGRGTWTWWAPEQLMSRVSKASEAYTLGLILRAVLTLNLKTVPSKDLRVAQRHILGNHWRPSLFEELPWGLEALLGNILWAPPETRSTVPQVVEELGNQIFEAACAEGAFPGARFSTLRAAGVGAEAARAA